MGLDVVGGGVWIDRCTSNGIAVVPAKAVALRTPLIRSDLKLFFSDEGSGLVIVVIGELWQLSCLVVFSFYFSLLEVIYKALDRYEFSCSWDMQNHTL